LEVHIQKTLITTLYKMGKTTFEKFKDII
jgi:hypothetical protein